MNFKKPLGVVLSLALLASSVIVSTHLLASASGTMTIQGASSVDQFQTLQLTAKDDSGTLTNVTWGIKAAGTDPAANVSDTGMLLGVKAGTVTVTAQSAGVTAEKEITITPKNVQSFACGGTATASTQWYDATSPAQAIDEDNSSLWRAGLNSNTQWFQLDMKKDIPVTGVKIEWFTEPNHNDIPKYILKASENGTDWTTVHTADSTPLAGDIIVFDQPVQAQYLRMEVTTPGDYQMGIYEFQAYGALTITNPAKTIAISTGTSSFNIDKKSMPLPLSAAVTPSDATDSRVAWTVTNTDGSPTDVASISATGVVTPLKNGTVKVTATAVDGSDVSTSQQVTLSNQDLINVALNKSATATQEVGGYEASKAFDGNMTSRWAPGGGSKQDYELKVDLGGAFTISTIALYCDPGAFPTVFKLQYSNDNTNWTDIEDISGNKNPNMMYFFDQVSAKYVRILSSATSNSGWGYSVWEFQVFGRPDGGTTTTGTVTTDTTADTTASTTAPAAGLTMAKTVYNVGDRPSVAYTGTSQKDWIGIYHRGDTPDGNHASIAWEYTDKVGQPSGTMDFSAADGGGDKVTTLPAGDYDMILLQNNGYTVLSRVAFTIQNATTSDTATASTTASTAASTTASTAASTAAATTASTTASTGAATTASTGAATTASTAAATTASTAAATTASTTETSAATSAATYTMSGQLLSDGKPVANAELELHSTIQTAITDDNGYFTFTSVEAGTHTLSVTSGSITGTISFEIAADSSITDPTVSEDGSKISVPSLTKALSVQFNMADDGAMTISDVKSVSADTTTAASTAVTNGTSPKTGDTAMPIYVLALLVSLAGFTVIKFNKRKADMK